MSTQIICTFRCMVSVLKVQYFHESVYVLSLETGWRFSGDRRCRTQYGTALLSVLWPCDSERRPTGCMCAAADRGEESSGWTAVGTGCMDQTNWPVLIWRAQRYYRRADGHEYANKLSFHLLFGGGENNVFFFCKMLVWMQNMLTFSFLDVNLLFALVKKWINQTFIKLSNRDLVFLSTLNPF